MFDSDAIDPDALLNRTQAATALTDAGYPTSAATLATLASRGGGPEYSRFGAHALYRWSNTLNRQRTDAGETNSDAVSRGGRGCRVTDKKMFPIITSRTRRRSRTRSSRHIPLM